jgi:predicted MFS family arabinose efflux permease
MGFAGWRGAFLMLGAIGLVWLVGFAWRFRDTPQEHPGANDAEQALIRGGTPPGEKPAPLSWRTVLTSPTLWVLSFMYFCSNAGWSFFITFVNPYLKKDLGLEGWTLHFASGAPLFFGGIGCLLGGLLTDRLVPVLGRRWGRTAQGLVAYTLGGGFFLTAVFLTGTNNLAAFVAICLASFVKDFAMAASWSTTIDIGHRYSGTVAGLMNTIGNLGTVISPVIVAWLVVRSGLSKDEGWYIGLYYYAGMFFIAATCWAFINPRRVIVYAPDDARRVLGS